MKKFIVWFPLFCCAFHLQVSAQEQHNRNMAGFSIEYFPYMSQGIYFDDPFDFWPNNEPFLMYQLFYARQVTESFRIGGYVEKGSNRFSDQSGSGTKSFRRNTIGVNWLGQFPKTRLHLQLGGYFGYELIKAQNWDNLTGPDFGMIAGPAFETGSFGVALHLQSGFSPNKSSGTPEGILLYTPRVLLKIYGKF